MMGAEGLKAATETAILSANYISARLKDHYPTLYASDQRPCGARVHPGPAPPQGHQRRDGRRRGQAPDRLRLPRAHAELPGGQHADGGAHRERNPGRAGPLHRRDDRHPRGNPPDRKRHTGRRTTTRSRTRPHTAESLLGAEWHAPLHAAKPPPTPWPACASSKYWSPVGRVDNVYGDRNLFCSCVPVSVPERRQWRSALHDIRGAIPSRPRFFLALADFMPHPCPNPCADPLLRPLPEPCWPAPPPLPSVPIAAAPVTTPSGLVYESLRRAAAPRPRPPTRLGALPGHAGQRQGVRQLLQARPAYRLCAQPRHPLLDGRPHT